VSFLVACDSPDGEAVVNRDGEELGHLEQIVIDARSGRAAYAVLARGGVFGLGERFHAVPWQAFEIDANRRRIVLDIARERLDAAPGFDEEHWPAIHEAG